MIRMGIVIAGTHSGCGKTSVALGIMAALTSRGYTVQPYKVGPDFIDPGYHRRITGREAHNLDGWMLDARANREIFQRNAADADVTVIEGVMGLYDGFSGRDEAGSTAQMAKWLDLPVVLVVDARSMARSAAALVQGYAAFDPELRLAGVVFNRVGSPRHAAMLEEALQAAGGLRSFGCLPRSDKLEIPSRHLGLVTEEDWASGGSYEGTLIEWIEENLDLDGLLRAGEVEWLQKSDSQSTAEAPELRVGRQAAAAEVTIGVARDAAFCFYYAENLRLLRMAGAELRFFSPLVDSGLPDGLHGIYLGGGYPELHCNRLAGNSGMQSSIRCLASAGAPIYAECGGFMYLMRDLVDLEGRQHPMIGLFPFGAVMEKRLRALGYRELRTSQDSLLGPIGTRVRGHEFHYSSIRGSAEGVPRIYELQDRQGQVRLEGYISGNVLGSYVHQHWGSCPEAPRSFVKACKEYHNSELDDHRSTSSEL